MENRAQLNDFSKVVSRLVAASLCAIIFWNVSPSFSQKEGVYRYAPSLFQALEWRNIGPFRGGRVTTVAGDPGDHLTYYMGATGGGVWKTQDGGVSWKNVSDGFFKTGSVGAIAVAGSDPNVIYAGMGESCIRGVTTASGDGVYKSTDAGKTWTHLGLEKTRQISAIRVHPKNPDLVYVAAQGNPWGPNAERGIYRSKDGGKNWRLIHHVDDKTGASALSLDVNNPRILYAGFWEHQRTPWKVNSGGPGSGIYKTSDSGDSWEKLTNGLPGFMGKIGVDVSPANPKRVWAIIEADDGGLFRSDNGGDSWKHVNEDRILRARAWYYTHVFADPQDQETVYVLNAPMMKSTDGGKSFVRISTPHGDNHALWINPSNHNWMINGNDGGANISFNAGKTWSTQANQPTAQFYRVITDNGFPYVVYGGQQDNSTVAISSRTTDNGIGREDWFRAGGCESAYLAFDPDNPVLIYAGCYQGQITEYNAATKQIRSVMAYPVLGLASDAKDFKYRFNWNAPIVASPHNPAVIYHAGNYLLKSEDRGQTWQEISPDLTRNEQTKQGKGGGPITNEAAGAETYNTIFAVVESPHEPGTIWAGTDDGLVHVTRDGGKNWQNVTPKGVGEAQVNAIEVSPHDPATAYAVLTRYKFGDDTPHIFKTENYGGSWKRLVHGIDPEALVRVVREDPQRQGLLFAGTETGLYISFNAGKQWQPFQLNLPVAPITDLTIRNNDLIAATQGRAFWILDDLTPLHQINDTMAQADFYLFKPGMTYRMDGSNPETPGIGKNPPAGAILYYYFAEAPDTSEVSVTLEILNSADQVVRSFTPRKKKQDPSARARRGHSLPQHLGIKKGMNRFVWNLRCDDISRIPGLFTYGSLQGYRVGPGMYKARLSVDKVSKIQTFEVLNDPRKMISSEDFAEQQMLLADLWENTDSMHKSVIQMQEVRKQVEELLTNIKSLDGAESIRETGDSLVTKMSDWEAQLVQRKQKTFQDVINFPNKLNAQFIYLLSTADEADPPLTNGVKQRFADVLSQWEKIQVTQKEILEKDVPAFNALFQEHRIPAVIIPSKTQESKPAVQ
ncbi:MAG: WD40/YVTN/BNR-like repeat-containing protein [bacterium]